MLKGHSFRPSPRTFNGNSHRYLYAEGGILVDDFYYYWFGTSAFLRLIQLAKVSENIARAMASKNLKKLDP